MAELLGKAELPGMNELLENGRAVEWLEWVELPSDPNGLSRRMARVVWWVELSSDLSGLSSRVDQAGRPNWKAR